MCTDHRITVINQKMWGHTTTKATKQYKIVFEVQEIKIAHMMCPFRASFTSYVAVVLKTCYGQLE